MLAVGLEFLSHALAFGVVPVQWTGRYAAFSRAEAIALRRLRNAELAALEMAPPMASGDPHRLLCAVGARVQPLP